LPYLTRVAALAAVYLAAAKLELSLAFTHPSVSLVRPPTGIALAALLLFGYRLWPGVAMGAFLANATMDVSLATAAGIGMGNILEALTGAYLLRRFAGFRNSLERLQDALSLVVLAGALSTTVSATTGVTSLFLGGSAAWADYGSLWWQWWLGDAMGDLVVAPVILAWAARPRIHWQPRQVAETGAIIVSLVAVGEIVFGGWIVTDPPTYPLAFAVFPFVIWATVRLGMRGAATATLAVSGIAIWGTVPQRGPFVGRTPTESLLLLQIFMAVVSVTVLALATAIAQRRRAEEERSRLAFIVESSDDAIIGTTLDGTITSWNPGAERLYGYSAEEVQGRSIVILHPPEHPNDLLQNLERLRRGERVIHYETVRVRKDGTRIDISLTVSPVRDSNGTVIGASGIARDISDRKRLEAAEREAVALRFVAALATAAAHEINNPLSAVKGNLQLLARRTSDSTAHQRIESGIEAADRIHEIVCRMNRVVRLAFLDPSPNLPDMLDLWRASAQPEDKQAP
jgi:PAS domain S-box-containing protein